MNRFVDTITIPFAASIAQAVALVPTGLFLFGMSTAVLFSNEGRTDFGDLVAGAQALDPESIKSREGQLATLSGALRVDEPLGDAEYWDPGKFAAAIRIVETWAWTERVTRQERRNWGGGREVDTLTEYALDWTATPLTPERMRYPEGHENPPITLRSAGFASA